MPEAAVRHPSPEAGEGTGKGATHREFALTTSAPTSPAPDGIAIYAEWETEPHEWSHLRAHFRSPRPTSSPASP
jgi:hypothetical protein